MDAQVLISELLCYGLSQQEIAAHIGLDQSGVSRLLHGERSRVSYEVGERLLRLYRRKSRRVKP
jgi:transcriptional regulator with XRE-family HTH domain